MGHGTQKMSQTLSHGHHPMGHGDIAGIIDPFPWACCNGPWDLENAMDSAPWASPNRTWDTENVTSLVPWASYNETWENCRHHGPFPMGML
jgi:hypothetical protein